MMTARPRMALIPAAALIALATPIWLLQDRSAAPADAIMPNPRMLVPKPAPMLDVALGRPLFATVSLRPSVDAEAADGPQLIGVVGRLGGDAVAMVRIGEGRTRTLAPGQSSDGWRLESIGQDAVLFSRGAQRRRVELPATDEPAAADQ